MMHSEKYCDIEALRFLGILFIMLHHLYLLGYSTEYTYLGANCWVWVDFFFLLTGAFTTKHFDRNTDYEDCGMVALKYTWQKFSHFFIYTSAAIIVQHILLDCHSIVKGRLREFMVGMINAPFEMIFLSSSGIVEDTVLSLWFLSAMFIVFPIFVYILIKHQEFEKVLSLTFPILYFGYMGVNTIRTYPNDLLRAFACMNLGVFSYNLSKKLSEAKLNCIKKLAVNFLGIGTLLFASYITLMNKKSMNIVELLFLIAVTVLMSRRSTLSKLKGDLWIFLGKMSMPVFVFHWNVGTFANMITDELFMRTLIYFVGTIVLASLLVIFNILRANRFSRSVTV